MNALKVIGIAKSFGEKELFHDVSFELKKGERTALIGRNGKGKTTLFHCLLGSEEIDHGDIIFSQMTTGHLEQEHAFEGKTIQEIFEDAFQDIIALGDKKALLEKELSTFQKNHLGEEVPEDLLSSYTKTTEAFEQKGGYDFRYRIKKIAFGLGFSERDFSCKVDKLSGGEKTRVALAKALIKEPDLLLLDEPTNHLDIEMMNFLEEYLLSYKGSVLFISHDRYFIDRVATKILELESCTITTYEGNYAYFQRVKKARREAQKRAYEKQQAYIQKQEAYIERYKAGIKAKQARGRQSQLDRLPRITLLREEKAISSFRFPMHAKLPQKVLELEDITLQYNERVIYQALSMTVQKNERIGIIGKNGAGKTSLLKIILGENKVHKGRVKIGTHVTIAYFSQEHENLNLENTILEEIQGEFYLQEEDARKRLGAFLFQGDEVFQTIKNLSGGEKARLAILKIMLSGANLLLLDEPTNHLDIPAKEVIEEALEAFEGTFIAISHDRYFLDKVANTILEVKDGKIESYAGNYSCYEEKTKLKRTEAPTKIEKPAPKTVSKKEKNLPKKIPPVTRRITTSKEKLDEAIQKREAQILMAEAELKAIACEMNDPHLQKDPCKSQEIAELYAKKEAEIKDHYEAWEELLEKRES